MVLPPRLGKKRPSGAGYIAMRASKLRGWDWSQWANYDFCPGLNRYVYWLKEPVGWFVLATVCSVLVGAFLSPLGWTVAMGLVAVLILGLGFPWIATRSIRCELAPQCTEVREADASSLILKITNRLPLPVMGLMIEGWDEGDGAIEEGATSPNRVGLARVPAWSKASYRVPYVPEYRGRYPKGTPRVACSFPFGIWTARREIQNVQPVTVWPMAIPVQGDVEVTGDKRADSGFGQRVSTSGDFLGVRDFRHGDSLKSIHWVQSARMDQWIVCERGGPQRETLELRIETGPSLGGKEDRRENLAWRVRIAASLVDVLVAHHVPFRLFIDGMQRSIATGSHARERCLDLLAEIPVDDSDGKEGSRSPKPPQPGIANRWNITAVGEDGLPLSAHQVHVRIEQGCAGLRSVDAFQTRTIHLDEDIASQFNHILMEVSRESCSA
ncbi:DUF58 domain-containing protein [Pirellula sp. SH-Sr6A]|uniref:DUF58 domain-containing protein n=1 Tax=Pirellula sp. SH-Sr6A TaxID=1632865 RepID=UPI00143B6BE1|nr:DUF58 domain-containing protein [Pirellula sp. SH-Sr6A]